MRRSFAAAIGAFLALPAIAGEFIVQGKPQVIDGDSLRIGAAEIRLYGIDAPEARQLCFLPLYDGQIAYKCGLIARVKLAKIIGEQSLSCQPLDRDRYGRLVAWCVLPDGEMDVAEVLVRQGWAIVLRDNEQIAPNRIERYAAAQAMAKEDRLGLWQTEFEIPARWRAERMGE